MRFGNYGNLKRLTKDQLMIKFREILIENKNLQREINKLISIKKRAEYERSRKNG